MLFPKLIVYVVSGARLSKNFKKTFFVTPLRGFISYNDFSNGGEIIS